MKSVKQIILIFLVSIHIKTLTANEEIVGVGFTAKFIHEIKVLHSNQSLYKGRAILTVSRPEPDTLVISTQKFSKFENEDSLVFDADGSLVLRMLQGRIASVFIPKSPAFFQNLNYLRAMASVFFVHKESYSLSYHTVTDLFGTCELTLRRNGSTIEATRDLKRCSHASNEVTNSIHFLPFFHVGMDLSGSLSSCSYRWTDSSRQILTQIVCKDDFYIAQRFSQESEIHIEVESNITFSDQTPINADVYKSMSEATESTDLIMEPLLTREEVIEDDQLENILDQLCTNLREHLTKEGLLLSTDVFYALGRARNSPNVLKYPCPSHIRRSVTFSAALVGGPRFLNFVHDQMLLLVDEGLDLLPSHSNPLITVAISNLGEPKLNPRFPVPTDFFLQRENIYKLEKVIEMFLVAGSGALPGVMNLLEKLKILSPTLFEDTIIRAAVLITPEEACARGNAKDATRILHAVSALSTRPSNFVASLKPCFATEDVGVQVSAVASLRTLDCDTPGVLELQQLALESPSDPEIRIAAFKGLVKCVPGRPGLLRVLQTLMDPDAENFSKQVSSFVWSFLQSVLASSDPSLIDLRLELEETPAISSAPDPVFYDPRRYSRHLERSWILDPRTAFMGIVELVWGRSSPAPRSISFGAILYHDSVPYDVIEITVRVTGLERALWAVPGLRNVWNSLIQTSDNLWNNFQASVENVWRGKREINEAEVREFIRQVISRIPADFQESGSSLEFSMSLFGMPAYHFHHGQIDVFLHTIPEVFLSQLMAANLYSEIFELIPLLDNTIVIGTSGGIPITLRLASSNGIHFLRSHYTDGERGSMDLVVSGGVVFETKLKVGPTFTTQKRTRSGNLFSPRKTMNNNTLVELFSDLSTHHVWAIDIPLSFSYETEKERIFTMKFRRPATLPHYLLLEEKSTFLNFKPFPIRSSTKCMPKDEAIRLCLETSENLDFSNHLSVLNNYIFKPQFYGIKLDIPKGYEPVLLQVERPEETIDRTTITLQAKISTEEETMNYEAILVLANTPVRSLAITLNTPVHKYYAKSYWSFSTHDRWLLGMEMSIDKRFRDLKFQVSFPKVANQRLIKPFMSITTPEEGEEEVMKAFIVIKDFSERSSVDFSGSTHGPLSKIIKIQLSGEIERKKRDSTTEITLKEFKVQVPRSETIFLTGQFLSSASGIESSLDIMYGLDYEMKNVFSYSLTDLGSSAYLLPAQVIATLSGATFALNSNIKYPYPLSPVTFALSGSTKKGQLELDINCQNKEEAGRVLFFIVYDSIRNFRSIVSVEYSPENIAWTTTQELIWNDQEYKLGFNVSWSVNPNDHFGILFHLTKESLFQHSLIAYIAVPSQTIEISHDFSRAVAESYKHSLNLRMVPGREITMNTVAVAGKDPQVVTYGLSVEFKLDGWENVLRIVGTMNCANPNCVVDIIASQGADQLGEFELKYTHPVTGISRTDIRLIVTDYLNLESSLDAVVKRGTFKFRIAGDIINLKRFMKGSLNINWTSSSMGEAEIIVFKPGEEEVLTHYYNGTILVDPEERTLFSRQELRADVNGTVELWEAIIQGKIGPTILNGRHFAKIALVTPYDDYYTLSGEASSQFIWWSLATGNIVLSADIGASNAYLIGWDLNFRMVSEEDQNNKYLTTYRSNYSEEGNELIMLTTLGRLKTPSTGEIKLNLKSKRFHVIGIEDPHISNSVEVRLVTETFPELGRLNGKLTHSLDAYSFSIRIWSGPMSFSVESYGVSREESLKSSISLTFIDPASSWQHFAANAEGDHLGEFPFNFEASLHLGAKLCHKALGSFGALAQWTPSTAALNLAFRTSLKGVPGGQVFLKWTLSSFQSRIAILDLKTALEAKTAEMGRKMDLVLTFSFPRVYFSDIGFTISFYIKKEDLFFFPNIILLKGRLSVNAVNHWILNIDSKLKEKHITVKGGVIRPNNPASFSVEVAGFEDGGYRGKGTLVIDASSHHVTVTSSKSEDAQDLMFMIRSSLLSEENGYVFRVFFKHDKIKELGIVLREGSDIPLWGHLYRLRTQLEYSKTNDLEKIQLDDFYVYREKQTDLDSKYFFTVILKLQENGKSYKVNIKFPEWIPYSYVTGTIHLPSGEEQEITCFFTLDLIDNDHTLEARISYEGESIRNWRHGRLTYRQQLIKGVGHPLRFEFEASKVYDGKKDFRFTLQKFFKQLKLSKGETRTTKGGTVGSKFVFKTFHGRLVVLESPSSNEYKLGWETDDSRNEAQLSVEKDSSGKGVKLRYERVPLKNHDDKDSFEMKGNFKRFPSEFTCSFTFEHVSIGRPRSLTFLHSEAEAYTELVLDVFKSEEDQIISVLNRKDEEKSLRIGQFGNNFLHVARRFQAGKEKIGSQQSFLAEIGGHIIEIKVGISTHSSQREHNECQLLYIIASTPNLASNHNGFTFCSGTNTEFVIQILGFEEKEGPYARIGEISGPGGIGLQLGGGKLHPLDTPPALTLMGNMKENFFEILFDCQLNSMSQLTEDLHTRKEAIESVLTKFPEIKMEVKGTLALDKALKDTERLLKNAVQVLEPFKRELYESLNKDTLERMINSSQMAYHWMSSKREEIAKCLVEVMDSEQKWLQEVLHVGQKWIKRNEFNVQEIIKQKTGNWIQFYEAEVWPAWIKFVGGWRAIRFNDNQSLYALVSRIMSYTHTSLGRQKGLSGFILNDFLTKTEQSVAKRVRWENIKTDVVSLIRFVEEVMPLTFIITHDTAFKAQIAPLSAFWEKMRHIIQEKLISADYLKHSMELIKAKFREWKLRFLHLKSWNIKGSATIFGWEQAISLDGMFHSSLLTDSCPHLLLMLTRPSAPIAITLHLLNETNSKSKVLTFISRKNEVTLFSDLKIKINGKDLGSESKVIDDLYVQKSTGKVRVSSSEGVTLECYTRGDFCIVQTSKENFAATAGLLGVFDAETNTDFMNNAWERPASTSEWLSSWRIPSSKFCPDIPFSISLPSVDQDEKCSRQFSEKYSPFQECLTFVPSKSYEAACIGGKLCSAEEALKMKCEHFIETSNIFLSCRPPDVLLQQSGHSEEGGDIRFDCLVKSDPPVDKIEFFHDGDIVETKAGGKISLSGDALRLHNVNPFFTGNYFCRATNAIGFTNSNTLELKFKHKPICAHERKVIDAVKGEMVVFECKIKSDPSDVKFSWSFSNGEEYMHLSESTFTSSGLVSRLKFVFKSQSDFGDVHCWASNDMGLQTDPCKFTVNPLKASAAGECSDPPEERRGTEHLTEEIVFIGEFSCIDSIKQIVQILRKESKRQVRLLLRYRSKKSQPDSFRDFDEVMASFDGTTLDVILTSIEKDFFADSLKAIILFNCQSNECNSDDRDDLSKALALSETMRKIGVQVYTVTKEPIVLKDPKNISSKIRRQLLGMDRETAYLMSHARKKKLKGKRGIRKHLALPENNLCAELSLQTDGAVFSLRALKKLKKNSHKRAFQQLIGFRLLNGHQEEYFECRSCACQAPCKLCSPIPPFESEILNFDATEEEEEAEEDYY